jgi:hypothetical protein
MKGQIFESPRGQVFIDAQTRDIVQNVYLRKVEKKNGQLYNVEFDAIKDVKDPQGALSAGLSGAVRPFAASFFDPTREAGPC